MQQVREVARGLLLDAREAALAVLAADPRHEQPAQARRLQPAGRPGKGPRRRAQAAVQAEREAGYENESSHARGLVGGQDESRAPAHRVSEDREAIDAERLRQGEDHARAAAQGADRVQGGRAPSEAGQIDAHDAPRGQELRSQVAEVAPRARDPVNGDEHGRFRGPFVCVRDDAVRKLGAPRLRIGGRDEPGVRAQRLGLSDAISSLAAARSRCAKPANCCPANSASAPSMVTRSPVWYGLASLMR